MQKTNSLIIIILMRKKGNIKSAVDAAKSNWHIINTLVRIKLQKMVFIQFVKIAEMVKQKRTKMRNFDLELLGNYKGGIMYG